MSKRNNRKRRGNLHKMQHGKCFWCRQPATLEPQRPDSITVDHLLPKSAGGPDRAWNRCGACERCNNRRGSVIELRALVVVVVRLAHLYFEQRRVMRLHMAERR